MHPFDFYTTVCNELSAAVTKRYSTSFSLGICMFHRKYRLPICSLYGFVRWADEIVDSFYHLDRKMYFYRFKTELQQALAEKFSLNPILQSFIQTVSKYNIKLEYIDAFLESMEMDLTKSEFTEAEYRSYVFGSAEAVGLMCLQIFTDDEKEFEKLQPFARQLGSAFQKVNFLRDIKSDYQFRGRMYFPGVKWESFNEKIKAALEHEIQMEFDQAVDGVYQLPNGTALGVYVAYVYYRALLDQIKSWSAQQLMNSRCRISNFRKFVLLILAVIKFKAKRF